MNYESTTLSHEDIDSLETILREANWTETTGAVVGVAPCSWGGWWQLPDKHPDRINILGNRNVVCSLLRGFASLRFSRHHLFYSIDRFMFSTRHELFVRFFFVSSWQLSNRLNRIRGDQDSNPWPLWQLLCKSLQIYHYTQVLCCQWSVF